MSLDVQDIIEDLSISSLVLLNSKSFCSSGSRSISVGIVDKSCFMIVLGWVELECVEAEFIDRVEDGLGLELELLVDEGFGC